MRIIISGCPIAKKRPRFVRRGNGVITYNPQETEEGKWLLMAKGQVDRVLQGPVRMECYFIFERPKSHFGTGRNSGEIKASAPEHHIQKPDIDNLVKFVKDCLNGVAYRDDCQIIRSLSEKMWGSEQRTVVEVEEI